jgi:hypothetical protein
MTEQSQEFGQQCDKLVVVGNVAVLVVLGSDVFTLRRDVCVCVCCVVLCCVVLCCVVYPMAASPFVNFFLR